MQIIFPMACRCWPKSGHFSRECWAEKSSDVPGILEFLLVLCDARNLWSTRLEMKVSVCVTMKLSVCIPRSNQDIHCGPTASTARRLLVWYMRCPSFVPGEPKAYFNTRSFVLKRMKDIKVYFSHCAELDHTCKSDCSLVEDSAIGTIYFYCHLLLYSANDIYGYFGYVSGTNGHSVWTLIRRYKFFGHFSSSRSILGR